MKVCIKTLKSNVISIVIFKRLFEKSLFRVLRC
jgi:hypothetical protein